MANSGYDGDDLRCPLLHPVTYICRWETYRMDLTPQDRSLLSVTALLNRLGFSILDRRVELGTGAIRLLAGRGKQPELAITITDDGRVFYE